MYEGVTSNRNTKTGEVICNGVRFGIEAFDLLEALKSMCETEADLLKNRRFSDLEQLEITITVRRAQQIQGELR
jgi:hypothetical protein